MPSAPLRLRLTAVAATALIAVTACSSGSDDESPSGGSTKGAPEDPASCESKPASDAEGTHTVKDTFNGDVEDVPKNPQRVVALWRTGSELADMCFMPAGAIEGEFTEMELGDLAKDFADVPSVGTFEGVDLEKVIQAEPDLIIGMDNGGLGVDYEELEEVAPTVIFDIEEPTDVWANYPEVAKLINRSTNFDERKEALDASLAKTKKDHGADLGDLEVTSLSYSDALYVDTSKSLTHQRLDAAGFGYNPDYTEEPERYVEELSQENLADLEDQDMIFYKAEPNGKASPELQKVLDSESFTRLPAAEVGHVYPLSSGTVYTFDAGDQQAEDLAAAAKDYADAS